MHLIKATPKPVKPTFAQTKAMIDDLSERSRIKDRAEDAAMQRRGRMPLAKTRPLQEDGQDAGRMECFVPKRKYWRLRNKYGRELFTTDAGQKDLRRHHPEYFTQTESARPTFGFSQRARDNWPRGMGRAALLRRRNLGKAAALPHHKKK